VLLVMKFGDGLAFYWYTAKFHAAVVQPLVISVTGLYLALLIARGLARVLPERDLLVDLGQQTLHIAANHLFVFYLITAAAVKLKGLDPQVYLVTPWRQYAAEKYWPVYLLAGIFVPYGATWLARKLRESVKSWRALPRWEKSRSPREIR
jgi:hypothetical protein